MRFSTSSVRNVRLHLYGYGAFFLGVLGFLIPIIPTLLFIIFGTLLIFIAHPSFHYFISHIKNTFPNLKEKIESIEMNTTQFFHFIPFDRYYTKIKKEERNISLCIDIPSTNVKATLFLFHGLSGTKDTLFMENTAHSAVLEGCSVVRSDASFGIQSGKEKYKDFTLTEYIKDIECVLSFVMEQNWCDKRNPIYCFGHGAGVLALSSALSASSSLSASVDGIILSSPLPSGVLYKDKLEILQRERLSSWQENGFDILEHPLTKEKYRLNYSFLEDAQKYSLVSSLGKAKYPFYCLLPDGDYFTNKKSIENLFKNEEKKPLMVPLVHMPHTPQTESEHKRYQKVFVEVLKEMMQKKGGDKRE
jgi:hypothetical protein